MMTYLVWFAAAALAAGMLGCASTAGGPNGSTNATQTAAALPGKPGCFWLKNFDGSWTALSQDELIVYAPLYANPYLIKLFAPVPTLKFAQGPGFEDSTHAGQVCDNNQPDLLVPNWQPHRVPIVAVHQLTVDEANALLKAHGLKPVPSHSSHS